MGRVVGRGHHVLQGDTTSISSNRSFVTNRFVEPYPRYQLVRQTVTYMGLFDCKRIRYTISTPSPGIRYDLAQLYQGIPYLNVPGTWYLSWKRSPTRNGLTVGWLYLDIARLLCAYSRDSIVWLSYAHDLRQATCYRAAQPLYHRTVTSFPIDSSNRNIVINWLVKTLLIWVYSTVRGYDTPSVPVHHRQGYDTTWLNFTKWYPAWMYLVPVISRGSGADTKYLMGWPWVD